MNKSNLETKRPWDDLLQRGGVWYGEEGWSGVMFEFEFLFEFEFELSEWIAFWMERRMGYKLMNE